MSKWMLVLGLAAAFMFTSFVGAKDKAAAGLKGKITAVSTDPSDAKKITGFTVTSGHKGETKDTVLKVDDKCTVTKEDGTTGTLADVIIGAHVTVTVKADDATCATAIALAKPHAKKPA